MTLQGGVIMRRRDVERLTYYAKHIKEACKIYDLQGLCQNEGEYTIAVEAIDMEDDSVDTYLEEFSKEELFAKVYFSRSLNIPFVIMLHKKENGIDYIYLKWMDISVETEDIYCLREMRMNEEEFIIWWKNNKQGRQTKEYRPAMQRIINDSYFDQLMEQNQTSWTGNIDGFTLYKKEANGEGVSAIIECRISGQLRTDKYDPNNYFHSGGGDFTTWSKLLQLSVELSVPLILLTFSKISTCSNMVGAAVVEKVNRDSGLSYKDDITPNENVFDNVEDFKQWLISQ